MRIFAFEPSFPNLEKIKNLKTFFARAKDKYTQFKAQNYFRKSDQPQLLIYDIDIDGSMHTGLLCLLDSHEITQGNILRHENTLKEKEILMKQLIEERQANIKPILLAIESKPKLTHLIEESRSEPTQIYKAIKKETHTLTPVIDSAKVAAILDYFQEEVPKAYIADGHHRTFCINHLLKQDAQKYDKVLVALFPSEQLMIKPYNRIIEFHNTLDLAALLQKLTPYFKISKVKSYRSPKKRKHIMLYHAKCWHKLEWLPSFLDASNGSSLDLFNEHIVINQTCVNEHTIHYIQGDSSVRSVCAMSNKKPNSVALFFCPLSFKRLQAILEEGHLVSPKSTFFEPRMLNGLVVQDL
jgi:uncharacterized protein (DUF1015 family)